MVRRVLPFLILAAAVAVTTVFTLGAQTTAQETPAREITVRARNFRFDETNPPLKLTPGERVLITFVNDEPVGSDIDHNFKIIGLAKCSKPLGPGESETIDIIVPDTGEYRYTCCAHPGMGGKVILDAPDTTER
jgi:plastocyanin